MNDFAPGDLVTPISITYPHLHTMRVGGVYRVAETFWEPVWNVLGLVIVGQPSPHPFRVWNASYFRKIDKADESFTRQMRELRPNRERIEA